MKVLVLNAGSSSLKWSVLDASTELVEKQGAASWRENDPNRHAMEMQEMVAALPPVDAVGHRVVHGGQQFKEAVLIDKQVRDAIIQLAELAPLHNPAAIAGIDAVSTVFPSLPQVAAFDTAFHTTIPEPAARYALPWAWTARWALRRYGFHGLSMQYAVRRTQELLDRLPSRLVACHLGAGCSITAIRDGASIDTSMGFTPLDGVMMATRSGAVDPGLLLYVQTHQQISVDQLDRALNDEAGLLGVSGLSGDLRLVLEAADRGEPQATLAYGMFIHRLLHTIGGMVAVLGGVDTLLFTGGIGEHSARVRADLCRALSYVGVALDEPANAARQDDGDLSLASSAVRVLVVTAREDLTVLAEVRRLIQ